MKNAFKKGVLHGFPIFLGYLSVSFGFGITAVANGLTPLEATVISATNLTSAGQAAGVSIIANMGSYIEMVLSQFIINLRYALMGISLSQKADASFKVPHRMLAAFGITDEIFAIAYGNEKKITPLYMYGMILVSWLGWTLGTLTGAFAGSALPEILTGALGIMLYAMFIAIFVPPAKENKNILLAVSVSVALSVIFYYLLPVVSSGFAVIICAVTASALAAVIFPIKEDNQ